MALGLVATGWVAYAKEPSLAPKVTNRARPELDAMGGRLGAFIVLPRIGIVEVYYTSVFAAPNDEKNDLITNVDPSITVKSDWPNHAVQLSAGSTILRHANQSGEDHEEFDISLSGRLDVASRTTIDLAMTAQQRQEARALIDDIATNKPTEFTRSVVTLAGQHQFNRLSLIPMASIETFDFDNTKYIFGTVIDNVDRDRSKILLRLRAVYEITKE